MQKFEFLMPKHLRASATLTSAMYCLNDLVTRGQSKFSCVIDAE